MCVVSLISDHYLDKFKNDLSPRYPMWNADFFEETPTPVIRGDNVSQEEFDSLKKEVLEMKELLKKALKYDIENNEPHCEKLDKVVVLKEVAAAVGVDISEIFGENANAVS